MAYFDKYGVEFSDDRKTLVKCPSNFEGKYIIPDGVKTIGAYSFGYNPDEFTQPCEGLTSIIIPNSVTNIDRMAFCGCHNLEAVEIPYSIVRIEQFAFADCSKLQYIDVALSNANYCSNDGVLFDKGKSTLVQFPAGKDSTSYTIPNSTTNISDGAFMGNTTLTIITVPDNVKYIGKRAFAGCSSLQSISLPDTIKSIEECTFWSCHNLTSLVIPNNVTKIGDGAFEDCEGLTNVSIPNSVTSIGEGAFFGCNRLASIILPNGITQIKDYFFEDGSSLMSIIIPCGVTNIGEEAFRGCTRLMSLSLPDSISCIDEYAFDGCNNLTEIFVPSGQEERFCRMNGLKKYAVIIRKTSERRRQREAEEQRLIEIQQRQELLHGSTLFFDTETTGILRGFNSQRPVTDSYNWPRLVQLAWIMADKNGKVLKQQSHIIIPEGFYIMDDAVAVHHITTERARKEGQLLRVVLDEFVSDIELAGHIVGHNADFDKGVVGAELYRHDMDYMILMNKPATCTMKSSTDYCAIPKKNSVGYKWPSLQELYQKLFNRSFEDAHDALADVTATKECFFELKKRGVI